MSEPGIIDWHEYLDIDPRNLEGKPFVRGTSLTAEFLLGLLAEGWTLRQVLDEHPGVSPQAMRAVFELAAESVHRKYPPKLSDDFFEGPEWTVIE